MNHSAISTNIKPDDYEIGRIPAHVSQTPLPVIFFTGLDVQSNSVHNQVWTSFSSKKATDRFPAQYILMENDCVIPPSKQKKLAYDWYVPKGILKTNWLAKHLYQVPSIVAIFFELDWDDEDFVQKATDCALHVENLRNKIINRSCKIALVLLQKALSSPIEDALTTERATELCDTCNISAKSLFGLPYQDTQHFLGYIIRMETAFLELAAAYYQQEIKFVRSHCEQLNKTNHGLLFVRHQFKLGFYSEMKQDFPNAIKCYKQAYANLMEIRPSVTNIYEIMTIAGFLNYKICKLLFLQNDPREAISQFQKHINIFRSKDVDPKLMFEHLAWLSRQTAIFGELFDAAIISIGLVPSQTLHPGYYFYEAALLSIKRKQAIEPYRSGLSSINEQVSLSIIDDSLRIEFYGQRPWRPGSLSLSPLDMEKEEEGILALQFHEMKFVNHASLTVELLEKAMSQFKKNRCPRMMRYMMVLIGRQYFEAKNFVNCLNHLNQVLPSYRAERWKIVLSSILVTALSSAYLSANDAEFIKLGLEFISSWVNCSEEVKKIVQDSVFKILAHQVPNKLPLVTEDQAKNIEELWIKALSSYRNDSYYTVKMNTIVTFIEIKPLFTKNLYGWEDDVTVRLHILLNSPNLIKFTRLWLIFNEHYFNQFCEICDDDLGFNGESRPSESLVFEPRQMKTFEFRFKARPQDRGKQIKIIGISSTLGEEKKIFCDWIFENPSENKRYFNHSGSCTNCNQDEFKFRHIVPNLVTSIQSRKPKISINLHHENPAIINELYPITISMNNEDLFEAHKVFLTISRIEEGGDSNPTDIFIFDGSPVSLNAPFCLVHNIASNSAIVKTLYYQEPQPMSSKFLFLITFEMKAPVEDSDLIGPTTVKEMIAIDVIKPFSINFVICNPLSLPAKSLRFMEPFILKAQIESLPPFRVMLQDIFLDLNKSFFHHIPHSNSCFKRTLDPTAKCEHHFILYCDTVIQNSQGLGQLAIKWQRASSTLKPQEISSDENSSADEKSDKNDCNVINFELPKVTVENSLLYVETHLPEFGITHQNSLLTYNIHNRTETALPIHFTLESSDNFMYAGNRSTRINIPSKSKCTQRLVLYPLICGQLTLPKVRIVVFPDEPEKSFSMDNVLEEIVPPYLTVMPQEKTYKPSKSHILSSNDIV